MDKRMKESKGLNFRNFSPFYEKAMAEARRDENILKIVEKDIERRKWICYSQLTAAQRLVEKDLHGLRLAKRKNSKERRVREARSFSDPTYGLEDFARETTRQRGNTMKEDQVLVRELTFPSINKQYGLVSSRTEQEQAKADSANISGKSRRPGRYSMPESKNASLFNSSRLLTSAPNFMQSDFQIQHKSLNSCTATNSAKQMFDAQF